MTTPLYLEQYLDSLQGLPTDLSKNLAELGDLDRGCQKTMYEVDGKVKRLVKSWRTVSRDTRKKQYDEIKVLSLLFYI